MSIIIKKFINPSKEISKDFHEYLNSGFFDCSVDEFMENQIYYVAFFENKIVGARKVLTNFQDYVENTKWKERLGNSIDKNKNSCYFQALAVSEEYRNMGIGKRLLKCAIDDLDESIHIFSSLCDTNTLKDVYLNDYRFKILKSTESRLVIARKL